MHFVFKKINKKLLNFCLKIIKKHIDKQENLFLFTYDRKKDLLNPITWKARGITEDPLSQSLLQMIDKIASYKDKVVLDIGASLGITVLHFSKKASKLYAFEPQYDNFMSLKDQIKIRNLQNVKVFNQAVSDFNGEADFFNRESHGVHSLGVHNVGKVLSSNKVKVTTLDSFCKKNEINHIGLLKIDVEGFEADVLEGSSHLLKNKLIDFIVFEFSPRIHKLRGIEIDQPIKILTEYDYKIVNTIGEDFIFDSKNLPKLCDLIAFPK